MVRGGAAGPDARPDWSEPAEGSLGKNAERTASRERIAQVRRVVRGANRPGPLPVRRHARDDLVI